MNHANLTFGEDDDGRCLKCKNPTQIVVVQQWQTHGFEDWMEPAGEVSGHWCRTCNRLTAVFINNL